MASIQIALAVYNDSAYLARTLSSLAAQTMRDFHLTVLDDGSTDDSLAVARSFESRIPMEVVAATHAGRQEAKRVVAELTQARSPYWMVLDSDILLPPTALADMVAALNANPEVGVVCARARSFAGRRYGASQALIEDVFYDSIEQADGTTKWIVGGCALFRREALEGIQRRQDFLEDNDLSKQLGPRWKFMSPRYLTADHLGVPVSLKGLLTRGMRDGVRVAALLSAHPDERNIGNMARLVPLPLCAMGLLGAVSFQPWVSGLATLGLVGYVAAFAVATRRTPASPLLRLSAGATFCFMNIGFGYGYLKGLTVPKAAPLAEPTRGT